MNIVLIILMAILPACPAEDSNFCSWDASTHGNGLGSSFVTVFDVTYLVD